MRPGHASRGGGDEGDLCPPHTGYYQLLLLMPSDYVIVVANALFAPLFCLLRSILWFMADTNCTANLTNVWLHKRANRLNNLKYAKEYLFIDFT